VGNFSYLLYPSEDSDRVSVPEESLKCIYVNPVRIWSVMGKSRDSIFQNIRRIQPVSKGLSKKSIRALTIDYSIGRLQKEE
jgi:hypothetical protein